MPNRPVRLTRRARVLLALAGGYLIALIIHGWTRSLWPVGHTDIVATVAWVATTALFIRQAW